MYKGSKGEDVILMPLFLYGSYLILFTVSEDDTKARSNRTV